MKIFVSIAITLVIVIGIYFGATPSGRATWNSWWHDVQKADDNTRYDTR